MSQRLSGEPESEPTEPLALALAPVMVTVTSPAAETTSLRIRVIAGAPGVRVRGSQWPGPGPVVDNLTRKFERIKRHWHVRSRRHRGPALLRIRIDSAKIDQAFNGRAAATASEAIKTARTKRRKLHPSIVHSMICASRELLGSGEAGLASGSLSLGVAGTVTSIG